MRTSGANGKTEPWDAMMREAARACMGTVRGGRDVQGPAARLPRRHGPGYLRPVSGPVPLSPKVVTPGTPMVCISEMYRLASGTAL